ncbi:CoA transferase [Arthrobacter sp. 2RAF6]|uniref:CoA transferase n=1 Tax=Arthrobacter sp. 2RAF6 TaxID=3233002 RepID=UPI003F91DC5A
METRSVGRTDFGHSGPLSGLSVVELGDDIAVALTGKLLGALGAAVTRFEPETGFASRSRAPMGPDGTSFLFTYLNKGKTIQSAASVDGGAASLIRSAEIVIGAHQCFVSEGVGVERLSRGGKIVTAISGWGEQGPRVGDPFSDLVVQAAGGLINLVGDRDRHPLALAGNQAAYSTGMQAFTGTMIALHHHDKTGEGQVVRTSYLETVAYLEWKGATYYQANGVVLSRGRSSGPVILRTQDGHVAFYYRDTDWAQVVSLFSDPRLASPKFASPTGRIEHEAELTLVLSECSGTWTKEALYHAAQARGIPVGSVELISDLLSSEQYLDQRFFESAGIPGVPSAKQPGVPFTLGGQRPRGEAMVGALKTLDGVTCE